MNEALENIVICGRLGKTPELKYSKNKQVPMCFLDVAENKQDQESTTWHRVIVWGEQAEFCHSRLKTGVEFFVQGQRQRRSYTDKEGQTREIEEIKARLIGLPKGV
jgi:single-strand DNA-binding protein